MFCQAPAIDWDKTFGNGSFNNATALLKTVDGGFLLGGSDNSTNDFTITKVDARGTQLWQKSFDNNGNSDLLISIAATAGGGFVLGGTTIDPKTNDSDILILRVDATGVLQWQKQLIGNSYDGIESLQVDLQGNIIIAGNSYSSTGGDKTDQPRGELDMWIVKLAPNGNKLWAKLLVVRQSIYQPGFRFLLMATI